MKTPVSWLRDFTPLPDDVQLLVDACNELGFIVDAIDKVGAGLDDVVAGHVVEVARIQGADDDPRGARDASGRVLLHRGTPPESYTGSCTDSRLLAAVLRYRGE